MTFIKRAGIRRRTTRLLGTRDDIAAGAFGGAVFGGILCLIGVVAFLLGQGREQLSRLGVPFAVLVAVYVLGSVVGGVIAGVLAPLARIRAGAPVVGFLATMPVTIPIAFLIVGRSYWYPRGVLLAAFMSFVVGVGLGLVAHDREYPKQEGR
jgi:hypothetical protein